LDLTPLNVVEAYDTSTNTWSTPAPYPTTLHHAAAATVDGRLFVIGGYVSSFSSWTTAVYEYDSVGNDWEARAPLPQARAAHAAVAVNGIIYVAGGTAMGATNSPLTTVYAYNPSTNTWSGPLAPMPAGHEHLTASAVAGKIYVIGGRHNVTQNDNFTHVYDPAMNTWASLAPMPTARGGLTSWAMAGRVHVVGGENLAPGGSTYPQHEVYDPATNTWQPGPPLPTPRHGLTSQAIGSRAYVIGGGPTPNLSVSGAVEAFELK
jgi:N-acetylneuraminic acid mutarotase